MATLRPSRTSQIKRAQKESLILRLVSKLLSEAVHEAPVFAGFFVNRVELSPGKSLCRVYLYSPLGASHFEGALEEMKLYKPSLRKALACAMSARYTPDILFVFDGQLNKVMRIEGLLASLKDDSPALHDE